ncbi:hypothetical protein MRB53_041468 [Persea americana]|nr:hypothetical protein MRB53_041468 [Persea americana]
MMDDISNVHWDVLISGTGLPQSLLALALSRSGKRILHLDRNPYYGGDEAALNLDEFASWAERHQQASASQSHGGYGSALIQTYLTETDQHPIQLSSARAYALSLAPHLVYNRSSLLSMLVSSSTHGQLEFQAVGSSFIVESSSLEGELKHQLTRIPNGREDIFKDDASDLKAKRALMKFLRFVMHYEEHVTAHGPLSALTFSARTPESTTVQVALPRIRQYLRSIGVFGPGFGAVFPKWGGLAEVGQVACRACAVGGGVYMLDKAISTVERRAEDGLQVELEDGVHLKTEVAGRLFPRHSAGFCYFSGSRLLPSTVSYGAFRSSLRR